MNENSIYSRAQSFNLTLKEDSNSGKYYLVDRDGFMVVPGAMTLQELETWYKFQEKIRAEQKQ